VAHLTDFEELIARIIDADTADYMREAMACYMAGAYRGCIVMSFIALFDDLMRKLAELATINGEARKIHKRATKLIEERRVFERYLIDSLNRAKLIPELDAGTLNTIRERRNRAAHPSGHHPSAEEARFVFHTVIDRFLCRPLLRTTQLVAEIEARLPNAYFFTSDSVRANAEIVREAIEDLHADALPALLAMLLEAAVASGEATARNARRFILGLAGLQREDINDLLCRRILTERADNPAYSEIVLALISADGGLCARLDQTTHRRIAEALTERVGNPDHHLHPARLDHPVRVLCSIHEACGEEKLKAWYGKEVALCLEALPYISYFGPVIGSSAEYRDVYVATLKKAAGSSEFETANAFARAVPELDEALAGLLDDVEALEILVGVLEAARTGAFAARDLKNTRFAALPNLVEKAARFAVREPDRAGEICGDRDKLEMLRANYLARG